MEYCLQIKQTNDKVTKATISACPLHTWTQERPETELPVGLAEPMWPQCTYILSEVSDACLQDGMTLLLHMPGWGWV